MKHKSAAKELENHTLVITEKPDAAARIASALDENASPRKMTNNGVPFYVARRNGEIRIVPALGHLYTVGSLQKAPKGYPIFEYKWIPLHEAERKAKRTHAWIRTISKLAETAETFVDACDYDIEGSIISYNILKFACGEKQNSAKRMKYSTLTKREIENAYLDPLPTLDFSLIEAGLVRHEVDWLYGVNLSRALTAAAKKTGSAYATISAGRVQGPTLRFIARREKTIRGFVPTPYWSIKAVVEFGDSSLEVEYEKKKFYVKEEAERVVKSCHGKAGIVKVIENSESARVPPPPFDLGDLQSEAYKVFGYTPMQTSKIAQRLYLDALISYPRTSSQKLPPAIGYRAILKNLLRDPEHERFAANLLAKPTLKPREGKGEDPAHPAIYPSGNLPERIHGIAERKIWSLIVRRFIASFEDQATVRNTKITIEIEGNRFYAAVLKTVDEGWMRCCRPSMRTDTRFLLPIKVTEIVKVRKMNVEEKFTRPPPRYNPSTILKKMQKEGIGTKATRAGIVQTLYNRKYIKERNIEMTELGLEVIDVLVTSCPVVTSAELTRSLEEKMTKIQNGETTREEVIRGVIGSLSPIMEDLRDREQEIGRQLSQALGKARFERKDIGVCPICKTGRLLAVRSKKTGKRFLGCTQYFEGNCRTSFPLPQQGLVGFSGSCTLCGWPRIQISKRGRHPWNFCFNPHCVGKKAGLK